MFQHVLAAAKTADRKNGRARVLTVPTQHTYMDKTYALMCKPLTSVSVAMQSMNHSDRGSFKHQ